MAGRWGELGMDGDGRLGRPLGARRGTATSSRTTQQQEARQSEGARARAPRVGRQERRRAGYVGGDHQDGDDGDARLSGRSTALGVAGRDRILFVAQPPSEGRMTTAGSMLVAPLDARIRDRPGKQGRLLRNARQHTCVESSWIDCRTISAVGRCRVHECRATSTTSTGLRNDVS
jgi:hypothetical protein